MNNQQDEQTKRIRRIDEFLKFVFWLIIWPLFFVLLNSKACYHGD